MSDQPSHDPTRATVPPKPQGSTPAGSVVGSLPSQFGRYRIDKLLGQGAMGSVYLAFDTQLERPVALKVPKFGAEESPELIERFLREARSAAVLQHAHICQVYDVGQIEGTYFITMAYIEGRPLSEFVSAQKPVTERQACLLIRKVALALDEAHRKGIIHRDLKPANVMVNQRSEPVVMDFGLARRLDRTGDVRATQDGTIMGSPAYMSPEQVRGEMAEIGPQTDVYSLGVTLYELLTGSLPFRGSLTAVLGQILADAPPSPSTFRAGLNPSLEALCLKMLAKSRSERFAAMADVVQALTQVIQQMSGSDAPVTASQKPATTSGATASASLSAPGRSVVKSQITKSSGDDLRAQAAKFLAEHQYAHALPLLKKLAAATGPVQQADAAWATEQIPKANSGDENMRRQAAAAVEVARELIGRHDYADAIKTLEQMPARFRTEELRLVLEEASEAQQEVDQLQVEIDDALAKRQFKELKAAVRRFRELKPAHAKIKQLWQDLTTYGDAPALYLSPKERTGLRSVQGIETWQILTAAALVVALGGGTWYFANSYLQNSRKSAGIAVGDRSESTWKVVLTVDDPAAQVTIDGNAIPLKGNVTEIFLQPGEHAWQAMLANATPQSGKFVVNRQQSTPLTINLRTPVAGPAVPAAATPVDNALNSRPLPTDGPPALVRQFPLARLETTTVRISPDGKVIAALSGRGELRAWALDSGKLLWEASYGGNGTRSGLAFSSDSARMLVANNEAEVHIITVVDGKLERQLPVSFSGYQYGNAVAWMPNNSQFIIGGDGAAALVDAATGNVVRQYSFRDGGGNANAMELQVTADGKFLAIAASTAPSAVFEVETGKLLASPKTLYGIAFAPGERALVFGGETLAVSTIHPSAVPFPLVPQEPGRYFKGVAVSPDGRWIAAGDAFGRILLLDADSHAIVHEFTDIREPILTLAFSADGRWLAGAGGHWEPNSSNGSFQSDSDVRVWRLPQRSPRQPTGPAVDLLANYDLAKDVLDGKWEFQNGALTSPTLPPKWESSLYYTSQIRVGQWPKDYALRFKASRIAGADGLTIGSRVEGNVVDISLDSNASFNAFNGIDDKHAQNPQNESLYRGPVFKNQQASDVAIIVYGRHIRVEVDGRTVIDWTGDPARLIPNASQFFDDRAISLVTYPVSQFRISACSLTPLSAELMPDLPSIRQRVRPNPGEGLETLGVYSIAREMTHSITASPTSNDVAANQSNGLTVWSADNGARRYNVVPMKHGEMHCVDYSPDGTLIAAGGRAEAVVLSAATGETVAAWEWKPTGPDARVNHVHFLPDGKRLLVCSRDPAIRIWSIEDQREIKEILKGSTKVTMERATTAANGKLVMVTHADGFAHVWDLATSKLSDPPRKFPAGEAAVAIAASARSALIADRHNRKVLHVDLRSGAVLGSFSTPNAPATELLYYADDKKAIVCSLDNTLRIWDLDTYQTIGEYRTVQPASSRAALLHDGQRLVIGGGLKQVAEGTKTKYVRSGDYYYRVVRLP